MVYIIISPEYHYDEYDMDDVSIVGVYSSLQEAKTICETQKNLQEIHHVNYKLFEWNPETQTSQEIYY